MLVHLSAKSLNSLGNFVNVADPEAQVGEPDTIQWTAPALSLHRGCAKSEQLDTFAAWATEELRSQLDVIELHQPSECITDVVGVRNDEP